jgi:hypothetical protein
MSAYTSAIGSSMPIAGWSTTVSSPMCGPIDQVPSNPRRNVSTYGRSWATKTYCSKDGTAR